MFENLREEKLYKNYIIFMSSIFTKNIRDGKRSKSVVVYIIRML